METLPSQPALATRTPQSEPGLLKRSYVEHPRGGPNAHLGWFQARNHLEGPVLGPLRVALNYVVFTVGKYCPSLALKRWIYRALGMKLGRNVTIASGVMVDPFFPDLIEIGDNSIIGMEALILTHEFLHDRLRTGRVVIGRDCLVGARSTVLAGTTLGERTIVSAMSLVHKGTPPDAFVGGVPIQSLEAMHRSPLTREEKTS
jgi:heptaprenylglycerol acetyltransferase